MSFPPYHPDLASKELSFELYTLKPEWDDVSHFCIKNGGTVNLDTIQRKYISQDRLHPQYDMGYMFRKLLERLDPFQAYKKWFQNYFSDVSLEDALCMTLINLIRKEGA